MNWWITSAITSLVVTSGPMILAESARRGRNSRSEDFSKWRWRLLVSTLVVWIALALWFWQDRIAIAAGQRPLAVVLIHVAAFMVLFFGLAIPTIRSLRAIAGVGPVNSSIGQPPGVVAPPPTMLQRAHLMVSVGVLMVVLAYVLGRSDVGHQLKGVVILLAGLGLYSVEVQALRRARPIRSLLGTSSLWRAVVVFAVFVAAVLLTLLADWNVEWQGWLGVGAQWAVGIVGLAQCAGVLTTEASRPPSGGVAA